MPVATPVRDSATRAPLGVRVALWAFTTALLVGAAYLYWVRGVAIIFDLSHGIAGLLCL